MAHTIPDRSICLWVVCDNRIESTQKALALLENIEPGISVVVVQNLGLWNSDYDAFDAYLGDLIIERNIKVLEFPRLRLDEFTSSDKSSLSPEEAFETQFIAKVRLRRFAGSIDELAEHPGKTNYVRPEPQSSEDQFASY